MNSTPCPITSHFHIVFEQLGSYKRPSKTILGADAHQALEQFLRTLPKTWRGGVSVFDDSICHEDEMPLLHAYI